MASYQAESAGADGSTLPCGCSKWEDGSDSPIASLCATGNRLLDELLDTNGRLLAAEQRRPVSRRQLGAAQHEQARAARAYNAHIGRVKP